jgi:xanthine dehydrogenase large subunit
MRAEPAPVGALASAKHESAHLHVTGRAAYIDDLTELAGTLHAAFGLSANAHAKVLSIDLEAVRAVDGVVAVLLASDIPGENNFGSILHDDPILATDKVSYLGQPIFLVAATNIEIARRAARLAKVSYEPLPAIITMQEAIEADDSLLPTVELRRGDAQAVLAQASHRLAGEYEIGGQEQFYLEGQIAYAIPQEDGRMFVHSSTQHPGEVQAKVAAALNKDWSEITVQCRRMGGGFGGKETQPALFGCAAAIMAQITGRPVKLRIDRDDDFMITGKRHEFRGCYDVAFEPTGRITALKVTLYSRCGHSADLSGPVSDRAVMHVDNAYFIENVEIVSKRLRTNTQSNTAFRGFGSPQGQLITETVLDDIAHAVGKDPLEVRKMNFYGTHSRNVTPYDQVVEDNVLDEVVTDVEAMADYSARRKEIREWNKASPVLKRGLALTPLKYGIGYNSTFLNQGSAVVHIYVDGSILVNHGGTEMGQGLFTKVAQVVAEVFQVDLPRVKVSASDTSRIPNASATSASSGSDLNCKAAHIAADKIKERLTHFIAGIHQVGLGEIEFTRGGIQVGEKLLSFNDVIRLAYLNRVQLWSDGFYATQKVGHDSRTLKGRPFLYFVYGAAVTEIVIDTLTGEMGVMRVDGLQDVGRSLNPALDVGQIEGAFFQGMGWLTTEELCWNKEGRLTTHAPSTYKIPAAGDLPRHFNLRIWEKGVNREDTIFRSKAVGEPPLSLAFSVFHAIRDAVGAVGSYRFSPRLDAPATPERILMACEEMRRKSQHQGAEVKSLQGE